MPPGLEWEVLVVDNASTDATADVIASHADRLPLRAVGEPVLGLSRARNRAMAEARGDLWLWIDDDVRVDPGWLAAYLAAERAWPDASFFGGPIEPAFESDPPAWIRREPGLVAGPFAKLDLGPKERRLGDDEFVFGANMAFRAHALVNHSFDPALGKIGHHCRTGDETDLIRRLRSNGAWGVWICDARVEHEISRERFTPTYIATYHRSMGERKARPPIGARTIGRVPVGWLWQYLRAQLVYWWRLPRKDGRWAEALWRAAVTRGAIAGSRRPAGREVP